MLPFLRDGDIALIVPTPERDIGVGDVICYATPGRLFVHRVIQRRPDRFLAKGDALAFTERVVPRQVLGRVVAVEHRGGVRRLDTRVARWRNRAVATLSPVISFLLPLAVRLNRVARAARCG